MRYLNTFQHSTAVLQFGFIQHHPSEATQPLIRTAGGGEIYQKITLRSRNKPRGNHFFSHDMGFPWFLVNFPLKQFFLDMGWVRGGRKRQPYGPMEPFEDEILLDSMTTIHHLKAWLVRAHFEKSCSSWKIRCCKTAFENHLKLWMVQLMSFWDIVVHGCLPH